MAFVDLAWVFGGNTGRIRQGHAEGFDGRGHRVGGVHASAGTGTGATAADDFLPFFLADLAGDVLTVTLKRTDDVQFLVFVKSGLDRTAVDHDRRPIQPSHRDQASRHVLVTSGQRDQGVVPLGRHDRFDRIGDQVAALQAVTHALGAHRDAVADADGVEPHPDHSGIGDAFLHLSGQIQQVHVAAVSLVPNAGDANLRLVHVLGGHSGGIKHRLRRTLALRLRDFAAVFVEGLVHCRVFRWLDGFEGALSASGANGALAKIMIMSVDLTKGREFDRKGSL